MRKGLWVFSLSCSSVCNSVAYFIWFQWGRKRSKVSFWKKKKISFCFWQINVTFGHTYFYLTKIFKTIIQTHKMIIFINISQNIIGYCKCILIFLPWQRWTGINNTSIFPASSEHVGLNEVPLSKRVKSIFKPHVLILGITALNFELLAYCPEIKNMNDSNNLVTNHFANCFSYFLSAKSKEDLLSC